MKFLFTILLTLFTYSLSAQDWFPFPQGQKSYYQYPFFNNSLYTDSTISAFYCDSMVNYSSYQTYYFDYSTPDFNGCYESVENSEYIYYYTHMDEHRPDSLIIKNDSVLMAFSNQAAFGFTDSILFLPTIKKDSTWISSIDNGNSTYNELKFTCDSIYLDTLFNGLIDSVKLITIKTLLNSAPVSSNLNTLELILSKNFGFKKFVSFSSSINEEINLLGIDSGTTKIGFSLPQFADYFHLSIGDVLLWREYYDSYDIMFPSYTNHFWDSITSVNITPDSVIYNIFRTQQGSGTTNTYTMKHYKSQLKGLELSSSIFIDQSSINDYQYPFSNNDLLNTSNIYYTNDTIINRKYVFEGFFYDSSNCILNMMADAWYGSHYSTYYGLTGYWTGSSGGSDSWSIIGSKINGVIEGNYWNVGIEENPIAQNFEVYPNPSINNEITVKGERIKSIELYSIQGKVIKQVNTKSYTTKINLENQPKGIYIVKVQFENGDIRTKKLVVN